VNNIKMYVHNKILYFSPKFMFQKVFHKI